MREKVEERGGLGEVPVKGQLGALPRTPAAASVSACCAQGILLLGCFVLKLGSQPFCIW
jgi:hypothetical protein